MKASFVFNFEFAPDEDAEQRSNGWGRGILFLNGRPYWYTNTEEDPQPVEWTWVDLLEHLAEAWPFLVSEQSYPFVWLEGVAHPGDLWTVADRRWAGRGGEVADKEEPALIEFGRRHNLSAGWKGLGLPALTWLRVGKTVWLSPEMGDPIRASFSDCRDTLVGLGNEMAKAYSQSTNPRVAAAVAAWNRRGEATRSQFLEIATGLSPTQLRAIQGGQDAISYWELAANSDWASGVVEDGELLAAARMTAGILDEASISRVLRTIRRARRNRCDELDALSAKAATYIAAKRPNYAFESGYVAAEFFKDTVVDARRRFVDVGDLLRKLNVDVFDYDFETDLIDAVAVWGSRGPCIGLNLSRRFADHGKRTRMTLAHELGHLLIDRSGGLPFGDVIGGRVDDFVERRANAFAAELLLPRASVVHEWSQWRGDFRGFLMLLGHEYGVSNKVACAQIHNCSVFEKIDGPAREYVAKRLLDFEGRVHPTSVKMATGVV